MIQRWTRTTKQRKRKSDKHTEVSQFLYTNDLQNWEVELLCICVYFVLFFPLNFLRHILNYILFLNLEAQLEQRKKFAAANFSDTNVLIGAQENGISAKEIKLAKILMDKPAPHCSAQAWSIYD